jgi:ACT domain-containing protein
MKQEKKEQRAIITVIGKDRVGILAKVSGVCENANANVLEVTQNVLEEYFAMIMMVDMGAAKVTAHELEKQIKEKTPEMEVKVMHEDIFNSMHKI